jgi:hypothetical protein
LLPQELNLRGSHLLFRDKRHQLHVYDLAAQTRSSLLDFCQYVQWVPGSDVVVAQSRSNLCVWYSVKNPDRCGQHLIAGSWQALCLALWHAVGARFYQRILAAWSLWEMRLAASKVCHKVQVGSRYHEEHGMHRSAHYTGGGAAAACHGHAVQGDHDQHQG